MSLRHYWIWALLLTAMFSQGCEDGTTYGRFSWDATVTEMTLTSLGVPVENGLPAEFTNYELEPGRAAIEWTASGTSLVVEMKIPVHEKHDGFSYIGARDGEDRLFRFQFAGDQLTIMELSEFHVGEAF